MEDGHTASQQFWAKDHVSNVSYTSKMQGIYQIYVAAIEIYSFICLRI